MSSIKQHFTSRFKEGQIVNADLSQIEVVIFAQLCKDPMLIQLLNEGRDIHRFMVSRVYNEPEELIDKDDPRRKDIKAVTFGIIYGNGPKSLAERLGKEEDWCRDFIQTFYALFPRAKIWHDYLIDVVNNRGEFRTPFGQILKFQKYPAKYDWQFRKGITESYNPPDIKNWPVQSSAHVIMSMLLSEFYRQFGTYKRDKYLLINTVHDSLMLDCNTEYVEEAEKDVQETLDLLPEIILGKFNIKMLVPIKIDINHGRAWSDL